MRMAPILLVVAGMLVFSCWASPARATDYDDIGSGTRDWALDTTWSPTGVPGATDNATINADGIVAVTSDEAVNNVFLEWGSANKGLAINAGGTLSLNGTMKTWNAGGGINVNNGGTLKLVKNGAWVYGSNNPDTYFNIASGGNVVVDLPNATDVAEIGGGNKKLRFQLNGGTIDVDKGVLKLSAQNKDGNSTGGTVNVSADGTVELNTGGRLGTTTGIDVSGPGKTLITGGATIGVGGLTINTTGENRWTGGAFRLDGDLTIGSNSTLICSGGNVERHTTGKIIINGSFISEKAGLFVVDRGPDIMTNGMLKFTENGGGLELKGSEDSDLTLNNGSLLSADLASAGIVTITGHSKSTGFINSGASIEAINATFNITPGSTKVDGGNHTSTLKYNVLVSDGTLNMKNAVDITTVGAGVTLDMQGTASFVNGGNDLLENGGSGTLATVDGTLLLSDGFTLSPGGGSLTVGPSGTLGGDGGTLAGSVTTSGTTAPGTSAGTLTIAGDWTQQPGGRFDVEILGPPGGSDFDVLEVIGTGSMGGDANVLIDGFDPGVLALGDAWDVLLGGDLVGAFGSVGLTHTFGPDYDFSTNAATAADVDVFRVLVTRVPSTGAVIPEPATFAVWLLLAAAGLAAGRRRRKR